MPKAWSSKDERKYAKIKKSAQKRGRSERRAQEIAARTVNKERREEGRTPRRTTAGTGRPGRPLEERTVKELRNLASELDVEGRSKLDKQGLVEAIRDAR